MRASRLALGDHSDARQVKHWQSYPGCQCSPRCSVAVATASSGASKRTKPESDY